MEPSGRELQLQLLSYNNGAKWERATATAKWERATLLSYNNRAKWERATATATELQQWSQVGESYSYRKEHTEDVRPAVVLNTLQTCSLH